MRRTLVLTVLLLLAAADARAAQTAYLMQTAPASLHVVALDDLGTRFGDPLPVTGLGGGDTLAAIDIRPSNGKLYALTVNTATNPDHAELYRLDVAAEAVTAVSVGIPGFVPSGSYGIAFNPETDRLRVLSSNGSHYRLNADNGAIVAADGTPAFAPGDPHEGEPVTVSALTYLRSEALTIAGADKSFALLQGNTGLLGTRGETGVAAGIGQDSLDASETDGSVWWLRTGFFRADAYRLDPKTGAALDVVPFDVAASGMALLPAANVFLGSSRAGYYSEADGIAKLQVWRSTALTGETRVPYSVESGTAGVAATSGTIAFADGETVKDLDVAIPQDTAAEGTQFFTVRLGEPAGSRSAGAVGGNQSLNLVVTDDDVAPVATATPTPTPPRATDRSKPTLRISGVPRRTLTRAQLLRGFTVRALPSEAVTLEVSLRANPRRGAFSSAYELALFTKRHAPSPLTRSVKVRPSKRLVGRITKRTRLRLSFIVADAAGNRRTVNRTVYVRR